jgi:hypothetical protein
LAQSPGVSNEWTTEAERLCIGFGERPSALGASTSIFAQPFGRRWVAVVQVSGRSVSSTLFWFTVLPARSYVDWLGDPFGVAAQCPPSWNARGELSGLPYPTEPVPRRTVEEVQRILRNPSDADRVPRAPFLLGAAQALVDGSRVVIERDEPDTQVLSDLWTLLPHSTRSRIWPASYALAPTLRFDVLVVPDASHNAFVDCLTEDQAADYPQGRYELNLQIAAEEGDQQAIDALFARRSRAQTFRLGLLLLAGTVGLFVIAEIARLLIKQ